MRIRLAPLLRSVGIDPKRFWLLIDLFGMLSERGEMMDQLGRSGVGLKYAAWLYMGMFGLLGLGLGSSGPAVYSFLSVFAFLTGFLMLGILMSETGNSLINPNEAMVLAHQPINGATYTAAKLTHLLRIVVLLGSAMNALPALVGVFLRRSGPWYWFLHMAVTLTVGLLAALLCCSLFGWLIRMVPVKRLKAAGQFASMAPFLLMSVWQYARNWFAGLSIMRLLPAQPGMRWALLVVAVIASIAIFISGLRALSVDYLIRVSSIVKSGSSAGARSRPRGIGLSFAGFMGGAAGRAAFLYVSRMMRRDWQFRRQIFSTLLPLMVPFIVGGRGSFRVDPFSGQFSIFHVVPHLFGIILFMVCAVLRFGSDYKGAWLFAVAPATALKGFARGTYALLWLEFVLIPHLFLALITVLLWNPWHALTFTGYSVAMVSFYLALEIRGIKAIPFSKQVQADRGATLLPLMILGGMAIAVLVAFQHFLLFKSPWLVLAAAGLIGGLVAPLTKKGLGVMEVAFRFEMGMEVGQVGSIYKEVDV